jgi:NAD(P)-dependent dehydrogenase (short-subunit alcohol dehydrogenase family)
VNLGLEGRRVLVTGGSGRIGRAIAIAFGAEGARVALTYRERIEDARVTAEAVREAGGEATIAALDLSRPDDISRTVAAIEKELGGGLEVLVNNAVAWPARTPGAVFETVELNALRKSVEANLVGHYAVSQAVVGSMREAGWGRIVHLSTGLVEDGFPGSAPYTAAKAGLHGLARTMSRELAGDGIYTNVVMAGFLGDPAMPEEILDQGRRSAATRRLTSPGDVARLIVFLCSPANGSVTGEAVRADGHFLTIVA